MMTTSENITHTSGTGTLTALRALTTGPSGSIDDALRAADSQAELLQGLLPITTSQIPTNLTDLIPSIIVEHIDDIPVSGISFWSARRWHIHIRASDSPGVQTFTVLHELKHIIDHPLRRQATELSDVDWEALADHFATRVLTQMPRLVTSPPGRRP